MIKLSSVIGNSVSIPKCSIEMKSSVFRSFLQYEVVKKSKELVLLDGPDNVLHLANFFVTGDPKLKSFRGAINVFRMAEYYEIEELRSICRKYLLHNLHLSNVCEVYEFACEKEDDLLKFNCWKIFDDCWFTVIHSSSFLQSGTETIMTFVSRPKYKKFNEFILFKSIYNWACRKYFNNRDDQEETVKFEKIREYMLPYLPLVRFLSMNTDELRNVFSTNVLTSSEIKYITSSMNNCLHPRARTICSLSKKRTEECYSSLIVYVNRHEHGDRLERFVDAETNFYCTFYSLENCFLTHVILPIKKPTSTPIDGVRMALTYSGFSLTGNYSCSSSGEISLECPKYLNKRELVTIVCQLPTNLLLSERIKVCLGAKLFVTPIETLSRDPLEKPWNKYYLKIRLYF
ncbi:uncharacterized protein LOC111618126 [Centruroides sculpturatus]|uniref:uncharacterized protein LOC111618126 n=1 Tax=Centruroides sculpturatus TaxID=218467 RepID=UPI000C6EBF43|nr:uncharacterized protein LOC111618126 [Centruroides sculpturatus]